MAKPSGKSVSPIAAVVTTAAGTPSWLKGTYRPQPPPPPPARTAAAAVDHWCKERIDNIKATIEGKSDALRDLKKVMADLEYAAIQDEIALISSIRQDFWKARERQRKASADLLKAEAEIHRIDLHAAQIDGKINRLKSYVKFIEGGWTDEGVLHMSPSKTEPLQSNVKTEDPSKSETTVKTEVKLEPVELPGRNINSDDSTPNDLKRHQNRNLSVTR